MPNKSTLHVDQLLSQISVKYRPQGYIAMDVFPELPVKKDSDLYRIYVRNWRLPETRRANRGISNEHDFAVTTSAYNLEKHALKAYISDDDKDNYDLADLRADHTENLTDAILLRMEKKTADLFTSTNWSLNVSLASGAAFTDNTTTSNPIPVFDTASAVVLRQSGFKTNFGWMTLDTLNAVKNHTSIVDRIKYTSREITEGMIGALIGVPNLLIANGVYDTSAEGTTESISNIWPTYCFVGYKPAKASPLAPSSGYVFRKSTPMVRRWRVEERESEAVEVQQKYDVRIVASLSGYLIKGV